MNQDPRQIADTAAAISGGAAVSITLFGIPIDQWYFILGVILLLAQLGWFVYSKVKEVKNGRSK